MGAHSHVCHSSARDFPELCVYTRDPFSLVNLGFHFGRVGMRHVEVACVSTSLTPWIAQVPQNVVGLIRTHATQAPVISQVRLFPRSLGSSEPGNSILGTLACVT